ncbi:double-cubane-cluster-containing anaerobic reductase [Proteinivorax hydrogeniformans]|uniref:Double-cubane-cluster-containing anaerobic reductase n=1 Tax=Proteinivorax hydrogeniformans TaxID=1826727 RepID=A0AAU8HVM6_9FIRM
MRAKTMEYFDSLIAESAVKIKEEKEKGKKVMGYYCVFSPVELIEASGAFSVGLCATKQEPIAAAEKHLPRNLCPLIKSSYGFAITDKCPYFFFADAVMAETTCDGKKKMYELMADIKPMVVLDIPNSSVYEKRKQHWMDEIYRAKDFIKGQLGLDITEDKLKEKIKEHNEERKLLMELVALNKSNPTPISGSDLLKVLWGRQFKADREEYISKVKDLMEELQDIIANTDKVKGPRILVTGSPTGVGQEKVINAIEELGGQVVLQEACSGVKGLVDLVDEDKNPYEALAEKYMDIPCSCTSPNTRRFDLTNKLVEEYNIDGIVDITLQACHTYNIESYQLKKAVNAPFTQIETDYSQSDVEQIKLRISSLFELIEG